jgi:hypothetical protein
MAERFQLLEGGRVHEVAADLSGGGVRLAAEDVERVLGWKLEPRGLCRAGVCVPVGALADRVGPGGVDLEAFAQLLRRPLALDVEERAGALGVAPADRAEQLAGLEAPDFALPDLAGRRHRLSAHRGKKVLLIAYASW